MINRLRKAKVHADALEQLCVSFAVIDARSKLETKAYAYWISGYTYTLLYSYILESQNVEFMVICSNLFIRCNDPVMGGVSIMGDT